MTAKVPAVIYAKRVRTTSDDYLVASSKETELCDMGETVEIGIYRLIQTIKVRGEAVRRK